LQIGILVRRKYVFKVNVVEMLGGRAEKYLSMWGNNNELVIDFTI